MEIRPSWLNAIQPVAQNSVNWFKPLSFDSEPHSPRSWRALASTLSRAGHSALSLNIREVSRETFTSRSGRSAGRGRRARAGPLRLPSPAPGNRATKRDRPCLPRSSSLLRRAAGRQGHSGLQLQGPRSLSRSSVVVTLGAWSRPVLGPSACAYLRFPQVSAS